MDIYKLCVMISKLGRGEQKWRLRVTNQNTKNHGIWIIQKPCGHNESREKRSLKMMINILFVANNCILNFGPTLHLLLSLTHIKVAVYLWVALPSVEGWPSNMGPSCCCVFLSANTHVHWNPLEFALVEGTCCWVNYHSNGKQCFYEWM